jgi:transketolase
MHDASMLNSDAKPNPNIFEKPDMASSREGFGKGVVEAGRADERVVVLSADLSESTQAHHFQKEFPNRFVQVGVAEQNLATVSAGMANYGKIPFFTSYATFSPGRNWEQIRTTIAINNVPAICCGMHAGILTGPDGATHEALEDLALMRALPNMIVISPCDAEEGRKATMALAKAGKPGYLRFAREKTPQITTADTPFEIGKAIVLWKSEKPQVTIFTTGPLSYLTLTAAMELEKENISATVVNIHTLKPLDEETILREASASGAVVTFEEHQVIGGLGSAVAECLSKNAPLPIEMIGVQNRFGQSGEAKDLIKEYKLDVPDIIAAAKKVIARKK